MIYFLCIAYERLDAETSKAWEFFRSSETPTVQEMLLFLDKQAKALSNVHYLENIKPKEFRKRKFSEKSDPLSSKQFKQERPNERSGESDRKAFARACAICEEKHQVHKCAVFLKMNLANRKKSIREKGLCMNCLKPYHESKDCFSGPCARFNTKHNSLLCAENPANRIVATIQTVKTNRVQRAKVERSKPKSARCTQ